MRCHYLVAVAAWFTVLYSCLAEKICPQPFKFHGGICLFESAIKKNFCEAHQACVDMGGHLASGNEIHIIVNYSKIEGKGKPYLIGLSDLLYERGKARTGWRFSDKSEMMNIDYWKKPEPDMPHKDCVYIKDGYIRDLLCNDTHLFICVRNLNKFIVKSKLYSSDNAVLFNDIHEQGCYDSLPAESALLCALSTVTNPHSQSFYYDARQKTCTITIFTDSALPMKSNTKNSNWMRFH